MKKVYIGIDPGKKGGIAVVCGKAVTASPYGDAELRKTLAEIHECRLEAVCCLEKVGAMPGQGVASMFNFGQSYGYIRGVLETLGIPYQEVTPQKWKKHFGLTGDKAKSIEVCQRLFPDVQLVPPGCRKPHDGMAEALLMAEYARREM